MGKDRYHFLAALAVPLFCSACSRPAGLPSVPSSPSIVAGIVWNSASITGSSWTGGTAWSAGFDAAVTLSVDGLPESTAAVTLSGPGGTGVPLAYTGPVTVAGAVLAVYHYAWSQVGDAIPAAAEPITYQPGRAYTLTTVTSAGTASVTAVAPGQAGLTAGAVTWAYEGNNDQVTAVNAGATIFSTTGDADSPVSFTAPFSTTEKTTVLVQQVVNSIPGAATGSVFSITQDWSYSPL